MNIIKTVAPISLDDLKKYFSDKNTFYVIDYKNSTLKNEKLLTYLGNLNLPADIDLTDLDYDELDNLILSYLKLPIIVNVPSLEAAVIQILAEAKGLLNTTNFEKLIKENAELITRWISKLDSLTIYNLFTVNDPAMTEYVKSFPKEDTDELCGINFVSLLKHKDFYILYTKIDQNNLKYYTKYFNEYMFKGKNLYEYWANENNPLFLLTFGISTGIVKKLGEVEKEVI